MDALHIAVSHDGLYAIQGQLLPGTTTSDIAEALHLLFSTAPDTSIDPEDRILVIDADAQASHAAVVRVMEAARLAGIERVHFATQTGP